MTELIHQQTASGAQCALRGELNIYSAARTCEQLLHSLGEHQELEIDLAGVEEFDCSGVQILLLLKREAQRQGRQLSLTRHSASVCEVLDLLNLAAELGDPLLLPADAGEARP